MHSRASLAACFGLCALTAAPVFAVPFSNGDFTPGFADWQAEVEDGDGAFTTHDPIIDANPDDGLAAIGGGMAELTTRDAVDPADAILSVALFQTFDLPATVTTIEFDYVWTLSDPLEDFIDATLVESANTANFVPLFDSIDTEVANGAGHLSVDVTALAGLEVDLTFYLEDANAVADSLQVGNIVINTSAVPIPAAWSLVALGMLMVGGARMRR